MAGCKEHGVQGTCVECEIPQLARNHYFTGKLLVERDFTDEQRFHLGKQRRHNQQLHGWGTVCGLKVKQHPNPACRNQYVVIEPGTAIDCCGREILVQREEFFDFRAQFAEWWKRQHGSNASPDDSERRRSGVPYDEFRGGGSDHRSDRTGGGVSPSGTTRSGNKHTLQICLRYKECPTEEVPALFDECGCDDTACQPNRVLEGYEFDLRVDALRTVREPEGIKLEWSSTKEIVKPRVVKVDEKNERFYVLSGDNPSTLSVYSTKNLSPQGAPLSISGYATDLAISPSGHRVYVAVSGKELLVLDAANLHATPKQTHKLNGRGRLAVDPNGRLYALGDWVVYKWSDPDQAMPQPDQTGHIQRAYNDLAVSPDGRWVFFTVPKIEALTTQLATVYLVDATNLSQARALTLNANTDPHAIAVSGDNGSYSLYIADRSKKNVSIFGIQPGAGSPTLELKGKPIALSDTPQSLAVSASRKWLYLTVTDATGKGFVQVIDAHRVENNQPGALGPKVAVGDDPQGLALFESRRKLYATFRGDSEEAGAGGIAVLDVKEDQCGDIFLESLDGCPPCDTGDCVVLATIKDYVYNPTVPSDRSAVTDDRIDNLTDRRLLPSTSVITEVVKCLLDRECNGKEGEKGKDGADGLGIDDVKVEFVDCSKTPAAPHWGSEDKRTLHLEIPRGCDATIPNLPRIVAINWPHGETIGINSNEHRKLQTEGVIVAFGTYQNLSTSVWAETLNEHTVQVLYSSLEPTDRDGPPLFCFCRLKGEVIGLDIETGGCGIPIKVKNTRKEGPSSGVRFTISKDNKLWWPGHYQVVIEGDFILGVQEIEVPDPYDHTKKIKVHPALDANHLGPGLVSKPLTVKSGGNKQIKGRCPTGNGTEGGRFISWFTISEQDENPKP